MSKYTTQVRWLVESVQGTVPASPGTRYTKAAYGILGLDEFQTFDPSHRDELADRIIDHFYFREIGFETAAQFAWHMRRTLNEIMPFYNKMYEAVGNLGDILNEIDVTYTNNWEQKASEARASSGTSEDTATSDGTVGVDGSTHSRNVYQDTPMSMLDDSPSSVESLQYATSVTYDDGTSTTDTATHSRSTGSGRTTGESTGSKASDGTGVRTERGHRTSPAVLLKQYRDNIINVDMQVIGELETLFMGLW